MGSKRIYPLDLNFFKKWSYEFAYVLGFFTADANSYKSSLIIDLAAKDKHLLEYFIKLFTPESQLFYRKNVNSFRLRINSKELIEILTPLGVFPKKTGLEFLPEIPKKYFSSYLRGLFDGDGWVVIHKKNIDVGIVSSNKNFLQSIREKIGRGSIQIKNRKDKTKKGKIRKELFSLNFYSKSDVEYFYKLIYANDCFSLQRKKVIFHTKFERSEKFWTVSQVKKLKKLRAQNKSLLEISKSLKKSYKAISTKCSRLSI